MDGTLRGRTYLENRQAFIVLNLSHTCGTVLVVLPLFNNTIDLGIIFFDTRVYPINITTLF